MDLNMPINAVNVSIYKQPFVWLFYLVYLIKFNSNLN